MEHIKGYNILGEFVTVGGGNCQWTFAERDGKQYFIKKFLKPTYPEPESPGSEKTKAKKRKRCEYFEKRTWALINKIKGQVSQGSALVFTIDFFKYKAHYYKITEKVNVSNISIKDISKLPLDEIILIMKTIAHSLGILHNNKIVHGDLKPANILIQKKNDQYSARLIDFDDSYISKDPPSIEEIVGDQVYYSPEFIQYLAGDLKPEYMTIKSDIFSLGIVFYQYLTGSLPEFDKKKHSYIASSILDGEAIGLKFSSDVPDIIKKLIERMLSKEPGNRPCIKEIFNILKNYKVPIIEAEIPITPPEETIKLPPDWTGTIGRDSITENKTGKKFKIYYNSKTKNVYIRHNSKEPIFIGNADDIDKAKMTAEEHLNPGLKKKGEDKGKKYSDITKKSKIPQGAHKFGAIIQNNTGKKYAGSFHGQTKDVYIQHKDEDPKLIGQADNIVEAKKMAQEHINK